MRGMVCGWLCWGLYAGAHPCPWGSLWLYMIGAGIVLATPPPLSPLSPHTHMFTPPTPTRLHPFSHTQEATAAMKMHDKSIAGKSVTVELVATAREAVLKTMRVRAANPLAAQQLQSLLTPAQLEEMQAEQRKLAEQVASLRAQQRATKANGGAAAGKGVFLSFVCVFFLVCVEQWGAVRGRLGMGCA